MCPNALALEASANRRIFSGGRSGSARRPFNYLKYLLPLAFLFCLAAPTASAQVVITEIMYHASSEDAGDDFIEIYNPGPGAVDLSGLALRRCDC